MSDVRPCVKLPEVRVEWKGQMVMADVLSVHFNSGTMRVRHTDGDGQKHLFNVTNEAFLAKYWSQT